MTMETKDFEITQLTPELKHLLEVIKAGRNSSGNMLIMLDGLQPIDKGNRELAAFSAGLFSAIGNVVHAITSKMPAEAKTEALKIVYGDETEENEKVMERELAMGGGVMTALLVKAFIQAARDGKLEEVKADNPELLALLAEMGHSPMGTPTVEQTAEAAQKFFDGISDDDFANAELKLGGYVGPVGKKEYNN